MYGKGPKLCKMYSLGPKLCKMYSLGPKLCKMYSLGPKLCKMYSFGPKMCKMYSLGPKMCPDIFYPQIFAKNLLSAVEIYKEGFRSIICNGTATRQSSMKIIEKVK